MFIVVGAGIGGTGAALHYKNREKTSLDVTKVTPQAQVGKDGEEKKWPIQRPISTIQSAAVPPNLDN